MLRSLFLLFSLGSLLLISAATVGAQHVRPGNRKTAAAKKKPITSKSTRAASATSTSGAAATSSSTTSSSGSMSNASSSNAPAVVHADGKGLGVYAAPGMPVNPPSGKNTAAYDGPAPSARATKGGTTLKAGGKP